MKIKTIKRAAVIGVFIGIVAANLFARKSTADSETELRKVIENFRISLIKKDKPLLQSLFSEGTIGWQSVTEDASLSRVRIKNPKADKVLTKETYLSFIDFIVEDKKRTEETFSDVKISTNGDVASVSFDYVFLYDYRETNRGREYWLLVRAENGWKITSVIWSEKLPSSAEPK